jgi:LysM repeat protein
MSTLEKLLVLGVLILVGVILAISLFWSRTDPGIGSELSSLNHESTLDPGNPVMPSRSNPENGSSTAAKPNNLAGSPNPNNPNNAGAPGPVILGANPNASPDAGSVMLSTARRIAPSPLVIPTVNPELWNYRVRQGDTPSVVSKKLTGEAKYAMLISKTNEDRPLVPGRDILIPNEVFQNGAARPAAVDFGADAPVRDVPVRSVFDVVGTNETGSIKTGPRSTASGSSASERAATEKSAAGSSPTGSNVAPNGKESTSTKTAAPAAGAAGGDESLYGLYLVKRGDSLRKIARTELKSEKRWQEIRDLNNLKSDVVREGQRIKLPK